MDTRRNLVITEKRQQRVSGKKKTRWLWFMLIFMIVLSWGAYQGIMNFLEPYSLDSTLIELEIPRGSTPKAIGQMLADKKIIKNGEAFWVYTRWKGIDQKLKAGIYFLDSSWSLEKIAATLTRGGQTETVSFTIPEGFNLKQIAQRLEGDGLVQGEEFLKVASEGEFDFKFLQAIPSGEFRLEGFLFPDTYQINSDSSAEDIINTMLKRFDQIYSEELRQRERELGLTMLEVVTMASIIEREAKLDRERTIIAGVFYNRLQQKWRLESCATVQYLLDEPREVLLHKDLEIKSPYNTYQQIGLPPGPIASPGKASLEAALYPADVDYMFFRTDEIKGDGSHIFSRTLSQHNKAEGERLD